MQLEKTTGSHQVQLRSVEFRRIAPSSGNPPTLEQGDSQQQSPSDIHPMQQTFC